jgi:hypothetical protein
MKKPMYLLFAVAALLLAGGRIPVHSVVWPTSHAASILRSSDDGPDSPTPIGSPDDPNGPDGGPDGQGDGGPGAV